MPAASDPSREELLEDIRHLGIRVLAERLLAVAQDSPAGTAPSREMEALLDDLTSAPDFEPARRQALHV